MNSSEVGVRSDIDFDNQVSTESMILSVISVSFYPQTCLVDCGFRDSDSVS